MPPKISLVRHAQGEHNATRNYTIRDPLLTPLGKSQCARLKATFPHHATIDAIYASPIRRTIQTAAYSFGPALARPDVPFVLLPQLQEVSDLGCDVGLDPAELKQALGTLFEGEEVGFEVRAKVDLSKVEEGWNSKKGYWAYTKEALTKRAADLRNWLFARPEKHVVLVTHGAIAHFITEDWDVDDPMTGTAYKNCEVREFVFTEGSTAEDAHFVETEASVKNRPPNQHEDDEHVLDELETAVHGGHAHASGV